jgi:hypothetical protein
MQPTLVLRRAANARVRLRWARWEVLAIPALALALYLPALRFGLIWDDPLWYQQGAGLSIWQLFRSVPTFQYYRPLALVYNRLFVDAAGLVHSWPRQLAQAMYHSLNTLLCIRLAMALGLERWPSAVAGLFMAVHPYAHQAVAWQSPQQPLSTLCLLTVVLWARRYLTEGDRRWQGLSLGLFAVGLLLQESVLGALAAVGVMSLEREPRHLVWRRHRWLTGYALVAAAYLAVYWFSPRYMGIIGSKGRAQVAAFMLQALLPPTCVFGQLTANWPAAPWLLIGLAFGGLLLGLAWRRAPCAAAVGAVLVVAGIAPAVVGLSWDYVSVGSRLAYPALPGVALLWAGALAWIGGKQGRGARAIQMALVVGLVALLAIGTLRLQRLYMASTAHLRATVTQLTQRPDDTLLFLNYPDRMALRRPPYALGYWGIILAPPVQQLSDYAVAELGRSATSMALTRLQIHNQQWIDSPYNVDWRGERVAAEGLLVGSPSYEDVFVTTVSPTGDFMLASVGWARPDGEGAAVAVMGDRLGLRQAEVKQHRDRLVVNLAMEPVGEIAADDVLFVHVLNAAAALAADADSDLWDGYLPLDAIPAGMLVGDTRTVSLPPLASGDYAVTVGLYNRVTGERYDVIKPDGTAVWNGELQIGTLRVD